MNTRGPGPGSHADADALTLRGTLVRWQEYGDKGWGRGVLATDETPRLAVVGVIRGARVGDWIEATARIEVHPQYGEQVKILTASVTIAQNRNGVIAWISASFPMVGTKRAAEMIEHFGGVESLWKVIEGEPQRLAEIRGITTERALEIQAAYHNTRADRDGMITLRGWGLTEGQITKCMMVFGRSPADVIKAIRAEPYELYHKVPGFGWVTTDTLARSAGVGYDDPRRIRAALTHALRQYTEQTGAVYMRPGDYQRAVAELLGITPRDVIGAIDEALRAGEIVRRGARVYSNRMEWLESNLAQHVINRGGYVCASSSD